MRKPVGKRLLPPATVGALPLDSTSWLRSTRLSSTLSRGKGYGVGRRAAPAADKAPQALSRSARNQLDAAAPLGMATCSVAGRMAASVAGLGPAPPRFEAVETIARGGVLTALPALLQAGLRYEQPGEWGRLLGLDRSCAPDTLDQGLGLFAGLNAIPERSTLTEYSCRVDPRLLPQCTDAWLDAVHGLDLPGGSSFDLDFHTVPYHGRKAFLQKHYVSKRSRHQRGVLTFLVRDARQDTFCFIDATVRKQDQNQAVLRFVDAHRQRTGQLPGELVFDSRLTTYAVLARLQALGIGFLTLRRRSSKMVRKLLASEGWKRLTLHNIGRQYRHPRVLDKTVKLRGYPVSIRQLAVTDLGHERPTLLLTNQLQAKAADLIDRYARRMVIENAIAESIDFFHMDALSSEVPLKIDADLQFTMMAGTLYRLLARRIGRGHERQRARQLFERFVRSTATIRIQREQIEVRLGRRAHNPLLIAAGFREDRPAIPRLPVFVTFECQFW